MSTQPSPDHETQPLVSLGRDICSTLPQAEQHEWLITNGIGGYGCGTISGILTRCYHGLLVAALDPPLARTLLLTKLDETVEYQGTYYPLSCDRWSGGTTTGHGYRNLESFHLQGTLPTWRYSCADTLVEKRIWMQPGENTTYAQYRLIRASAPVNLSIKAIVNYRDHHSVTQSVVAGKTWQIHTQAHPRGLKVTAFDAAIPFYLLTNKGQLMPTNKWYQNYFLTTEKYRGLTHLDDHFHAATLKTTLAAGESITVIASTQPAPNLDIEQAIAMRQQHETTLLQASFPTHFSQPPSTQPSLSQPTTQTTPAWIQQLVLAADQFVVERSTPETPDGKTIIAGYPWFGDWGRDTMIALPGLTLTTGRPEIARPILRTFAHYLSQGMLPNAFPEANDTPGYNTVDATLWYFEAIRAYLEVTADFELLQELFPALEDIIDWHLRGTRFNIKRDSDDGLLYAGESDAQLTWMDAKVENWVVTPRIGKPVEINALWINALFCMTAFAERLGHPEESYIKLAMQASKSFERFWFKEKNHCYDVIDGPRGDDLSLRPNQIFAVSLSYGPLLSFEQKKAIVDSCAQQLLTSYGLRSLSPNHADYVGGYGGDRIKRDGAYHQGTVWAWLIGPFVQAHLKVYKDPEVARSFLTPFGQHLSAGCVGTLSEIFDGDAPFVSRGAYAQAWSVAEVLRAWQLIEQSSQRF
jgi:predicted glycogen debranching enzyme